jgi:pilus assembly protein CpaF
MMSDQERSKLGPLAEILDDPTVTAVFVDAYNRISVVRRDTLEDVPHTFADPAALLDAIRALIAPTGSHIDAEHPIVNVRLPDRSRLTAVVPPVSPDGPALVLHPFRRERLAMADLLRFGSLTQQMADFLRACIAGRLSILMSGGTNSGKTTVLNCLCDYIPAEERLIVVERQMEIQLEHRRAVRLEAAAGIGMAALITQATEMRPERLIAGELSGGEAMPLIQALITGHEGSLALIHATGAADALARLEVMATMGEVSLPLQVLRGQISNAFDLVLFQEYCSDGRRRLTRICEVGGVERDQIVLHDIFRHDEAGFYATGQQPGFLRRLRLRGVEMDPALFA